MRIHIVIINDDYMDAHLAARKQGAFVFWNHPHWIGQRKDGSVKMYDEVKDLIDKNLLHGIEVTNERTYSDQAIQAALDYDLTMLALLNRSLMRLELLDQSKSFHSLPQYHAEGFYL